MDLVGAVHERFEIVEIILQKGGVVNFPNEYGQTPLSYAVKINNLDLIRLFVKIGADLHVMDKDGVNLLNLAVEKGSSKTVELLFEHGVKGGPSTACWSPMCRAYLEKYLYGMAIVRKFYVLLISMQRIDLDSRHYIIAF